MGGPQIIKIMSGRELRDSLPPLPLDSLGRHARDFVPSRISAMLEQGRLPGQKTKSSEAKQPQTRTPISVCFLLNG